MSPFSAALSLPTASPAQPTDFVRTSSAVAASYLLAFAPSEEREVLFDVRGGGSDSHRESDRRTGRKGLQNRTAETSRYAAISDQVTGHLRQIGLSLFLHFRRIPEGEVELN